MSAGDAHKVWFPEMLDELFVQWESSMDWGDLISLTHAMTQRREALRLEKGIKNPIYYCEKCKGKHSFSLAPITVRSTLFALKKASIIDEATLNEMDREWKKHQRRNNLTGVGRSKS
ncbi:hypothetical protein AB4455_04975 [Vibrio sp. 10N.261.46.E12]|uniref:hypothetical protein n=1 Tax=unclassified Vibrio TaxID=2614977 RepID=UPI0009761929|nr:MULTISPECIES: hypothetical protein [unclassified Vibrio]OMO38360.1 hypothetical protein BH584_18120 [Vibrio sp. 10N.261.45.E1]PMJ34662.1 hypothetical protein BCU27_24575 [Vibrio sp. 10N.286.45.B6]PML96373.1 hypothetical protein BCT66_22005 [Vibrio sp. 10N.261.49.E11]PMM71952.1 hypothetical protein BCT48_07665 [Vibrio sp. 10N.261.46.F12]PMM78779.1 hypothetical protein BCT46_21970 [Vibrio sp. 10N.261.46.E8]